MRLGKIENDFMESSRSIRELVDKFIPQENEELERHIQAINSIIEKACKEKYKKDGYLEEK